MFVNMVPVAVASSVSFSVSISVSVSVRVRVMCNSVSPCYVRLIGKPQMMSVSDVVITQQIPLLCLGYRSHKRSVKPASLRRQRSVTPASAVFHSGVSPASAERQSGVSGASVVSRRPQGVRQQRRQRSVSGVPPATGRAPAAASDSRWRWSSAGSQNGCRAAAAR